MQAGQLDRLITLQALTVTTDAYGGVVESWSPVATLWAQFLPGGGNEKFTAAQVYAEAQARFRIRYRDDVTPEHRIVDEYGTEWDILGVSEIGRRVGLEIHCKARA